jgi:hypothetical protein
MTNTLGGGATVVEVENGGRRGPMSQISGSSEVTEEHLEEIQSLFVQTAHAMSTSGDKLTLKTISPSTLYFADRPRRDVGHMSSEHFVKVWNEGENSFAEDPPNAVVSYLDPGNEFPDDTVVVLKEPRLTGDDLSYSIEILDGTLPTESGPVALFIDPFGRPLSPVSLAGINRRERRRDRRGR